jgi:hypothetical protein
MATETFHFSGPCKWAKVHQPDKMYNKYSIDVQLSGKELETFKSIKLRNTVKEDGWVTFRRDPNHTIYIKGEKQAAGAPKVTDAEGNPSTELVGNNSHVTIRISVYSYNNVHGKGKGSRLESVRVDKLEKYEGRQDEAAAASPVPLHKRLF